MIRLPPISTRPDTPFPYPPLFRSCTPMLLELKEPIVLKPLPGLPVVRDLIVDMTHFFNQYHSIKPFLINDQPPPEKERLQSPEARDELNGLYECILCACRSEEHTSELQSLMRISYAVFCLKKKKNKTTT